MSLETLKWLRLISPGIIIIIFSIFLGKATGWWDAPWPQNVGDLNNSLIVLIVAGGYHILPLRKWSNYFYSVEVKENIRSNLIRIAGLKDDTKIYKWANLRGIFYHFVDKNKSLTIKSKIAYFNGFIWTTLADVRAICVLFTIFSVISFFILNDDALIVTSFLFFLLGLVTIPGSMAITHRHKNISNEQVEIIRLVYKDELKKMLESLRD